MLEDRLLTWQYNRGKTEVLRSIYERYKSELVALAAALLYDKNGAEDAVHDVFATCIESCGKLRLTKSLKRYLTTCVVNNVRNRNKARKKRAEIALCEIPATASELDRPDLSLIFGEELRLLARAFAQLPYQQREVLFLHLYSGLRFKAIAELQAESINTVQGRYRYGLDKLRALLNSEVEK